MHFYPYFPNLLSDVGEIRCDRSAHNSVQHLCPENCRVGCTILVGLNEIIITHVS
jgi:hypothetical protein